MAERTIALERLECPGCKADIAPPVGTAIPSLPRAVFWPCKQCNKSLVIYLDMSGTRPSIGVKGITLSEGIKVREHQ